MTSTSKSLAVATLAFALSCSGSKPAPTPNAAPAPSAPAPAKPAPTPPPPPPVPKPAPPISATALPPRNVVQADGITITEIADGSVNLKTTSLWNEAFDTTYQTCDYYRRAIPVLKRQIAKDRAKLLDQACVKQKKKK